MDIEPLAHKGKGLGRQMWEELRETLLEQGVRYVTLDALEEAEGYWIKMGFQPTGEHVDWEEDGETTLQPMHLRLSYHDPEREGELSSEEEEGGGKHNVKHHTIENTPNVLKSRKTMYERTYYDAGYKNKLGTVMWHVAKPEGPPKTRHAHVSWVQIGHDSGMLKKGLGRQMWEDLQETLREQGVRHVSLEAFQNAEGFWDKMGFLPNGEHVDWEKPGVVLQPMRQRLSYHDPEREGELSSEEEEGSGKLKGGNRNSGFIQRMMAEVKMKHEGDADPYHYPSHPLVANSTMNRPVAYDYDRQEEDGHGEISNHIRTHFGPDADHHHHWHESDDEDHEEEDHPPPPPRRELPHRRAREPEARAHHLEVRPRGLHGRDIDMEAFQGDDRHLHGGMLTVSRCAKDPLGRTYNCGPLTAHTLARMADANRDSLPVRQALQRASYLTQKVADLHQSKEGPLGIPTDVLDEAYRRGAKETLPKDWMASYHPSSKQDYQRVHYPFDRTGVPGTPNDPHEAFDRYLVRMNQSYPHEFKKRGGLFVEDPSSLYPSPYGYMRVSIENNETGKSEGHVIPVGVDRLTGHVVAFEPPWGGPTSFRDHWIFPHIETRAHPTDNTYTMNKGWPQTNLVTFEKYLSGKRQDSSVHVQELTLLPWTGPQEENLSMLPLEGGVLDELIDTALQRAEGKTYFQHALSLRRNMISRNGTYGLEPPSTLPWGDPRFKATAEQNKAMDIMNARKDLQDVHDALAERVSRFPSLPTEAQASQLAKVVELHNSVKELQRAEPPEWAELLARAAPDTEEQRKLKEYLQSNGGGGGGGDEEAV